MPRVLLNFQLYRDWVVHFIQDDCRTAVGSRTRYFHLADAEQLRAFVVRCSPEDVTEFENGLRAWNRGSVFCRLTDVQYERLSRVW